MINLIYFRYHHWITIALLMRESFTPLSSKSLFLTHRGVAKKLEILGMVHGKDFIFIDEVLDFLLNTSDSVNIILHHNHYALDLYASLYYDSPEVFSNSTISFYADGFTNKFLKPEVAEELMHSLGNVNKGYYITFDNETGAIPTHLYGFSPFICYSTSFKEIFSEHFFQEAVKEAYNHYSLKLKTKKLVVLLLRPWGSERFQNGFFQSENYPLSQIVGDMLKNHYGSESYDLLVRGDNRDAEYMKFVLGQLNNYLPDNVNIIVFEDKWVEWLTMDSFLYLLPELYTSTIDLYVLDSTAASPFILNNKYKRIFVGAPENSLVGMFGENITYNQIKAKVNSLKKMYEQVLHKEPCSKFLESHESTFFSVCQND